jgi:hypothetical protein
MKTRKVLTAFSIAAAVLLAVLTLLGPVRASAGDLDRIRYYEVTVDVNEDATLNRVYKIDWEVLDSTTEGPLEWVKIGIPNNRNVSMEALSDNISSIKYLKDDGSYARIDLDRSYRKGEVVSFSFRLVQDYMYAVDLRTEGETVYQFTPGWFNDAVVDELVIRWSNDKDPVCSPAHTTESGYNIWTKSLRKGERFQVEAAYPNDAYGFDISKNIEVGDDTRSAGDVIATIIGGVVCCLLPIMVLIGVILSVINGYKAGSGFSSATKKTIKRTKVEYYPICEGCGAPRPEGQETCEYCGRSFIKSEEVLEEKDIPAEESELKNKKESGLFRFASSPNTFMRVNVISVPVARRSFLSGLFSSSGSGSSSSRSHSSCAHSSCACACACACAGGGRAGCSAKDFYNTDLKLSQLRKTCKK